MDNLGVRLTVDATAKSKFKSERPHESLRLASQKVSTSRRKAKVNLPVDARSR
jgi:hypothetical protein